MSDNTAQQTITVTLPAATMPPVPIKVTIEYDEGCEDPFGWSYDKSWKVYTFSRHGDKFSENPWFEETDYESGNYQPTLALKRRLKFGFAAILDVYDHSGRTYSLSGEGMQCRWDTARGAALIVWEGKASDFYDWQKGKAHRQELLRSALQEYNDWQSGRCYACTIETTATMDARLETHESIGGFIGDSGIKSMFYDHVFPIIEALPASGNGDERLVFITGGAEGISPIYWTDFGNKWVGLENHPNIVPISRNEYSAWAAARRKAEAAILAQLPLDGKGNYSTNE